jgi:hypothetical protein
MEADRIATILGKPTHESISQSTLMHRIKHQQNTDLLLLLGRTLPFQ